MIRPLAPRGRYPTSDPQSAPPRKAAARDVTRWRDSMKDPDGAGVFPAHDQLHPVTVRCWTRRLASVS
jgi:hypothetical protein